MDPARAVSITSQAARALDSAHADGLIHRDVKPSNILVTGTGDDEFVYLVDFGIARSTTDTQGPALTQTGAALGSFDYMAPERFLERPADKRVDVYALACVLFEVLTGRRPFMGDGLAVLMYAHLNTDAAAPSQLRPDLPHALDGVILKGLAKDPDERWATAGEFAAAARKALSESGVTPAPEVRPRPRRRPPSPRCRSRRTRSASPTPAADGRLGPRPAPATARRPTPAHRPSTSRRPAPGATDRRPAPVPRPPTSRRRTRRLRAPVDPAMPLYTSPGYGPPGGPPGDPPGRRRRESNKLPLILIGVTALLAIIVVVIVSWSPRGGGGGPAPRPAPRRRVPTTTTSDDDDEHTTEAPDPEQDLLAIIPGASTATTAARRTPPATATSRLWTAAPRRSTRPDSTRRSTSTPTPDARRRLPRRRRATGVVRAVRGELPRRAGLPELHRRQR